MKIAQVVGPKIPFSPRLPHTPYSIPAMSYLITEELVKRGHDVTVFAPSDSKTHAKIAPGTVSAKYYNSRILKKINKYTKKKRGSITHRHYLNVIKQADDFDIIHNHELGFLYFAPQTKTPVVTTLHYHPIDVEHKELLIAKNNQFIAISKKQTINFPKLKYAGVVHHGINIKKFKFNNKPKNYIGWLGRITSIKGSKEAIEASLKAGERIKLAGNIEKDEKQRKYTKETLDLIKQNKTVTYIGRVGYNRKIKFLRNAKVVLMPIKWEEPFGLVAIEALACGTPVIAFKRGALPEIIEDGKTGFIVETIPQMAKAIANIDKIDRKYCRQKAEEYFNIKRMVDEHEELYKKVIKKKK